MQTCNQCNYWAYNRFTEETYGMGVGVCRVDGSQRFCEHKCPFCVCEDEEGEDGI